MNGFASVTFVGDANVVVRRPVVGRLRERLPREDHAVGLLGLLRLADLLVVVDRAASACRPARACSSRTSSSTRHTPRGAAASRDRRPRLPRRRRAPNAAATPRPPRPAARAIESHKAEADLLRVADAAGEVHGLAAVERHRVEIEAMIEDHRLAVLRPARDAVRSASHTDDRPSRRRS